MRSPDTPEPATPDASSGERAGRQAAAQEQALLRGINGEGSRAEPETSNRIGGEVSGNAIQAAKIEGGVHHSRITVFEEEVTVIGDMVFGSQTTNHYYGNNRNNAEL